MSTDQSGTVSLMAVGDIGPLFEPTAQFAEFVSDTLKTADVRMGQCERTYSERGILPQFTDGPGGQSGSHTRLPPRMAEVWDEAGINIVSMAGNHTMDWGPDALMDTIEMFKSKGMGTIGAGLNSEEARKPVFVEKDGVKVAFLSYCSLLRSGQAAGKTKVGIAPMRAHTYYKPEEFQPGTPPRIITVPYEHDIEAMQADIRKAKSEADAVVISVHWGLRHVPKTICGYQPIVAHAMIDAGADLIIGHHAHCIKAVEVYKGKVCFYSVGNFIQTFTKSTTWPPAEPGPGIFDWNLIWYEHDKETLPPAGGLYPFPAHCRKTMIAKAVFSKAGVERVSFLPAFIDPRAKPHVVTAEDPKFQEIVDYTEWVSDQHPHKFRVEANEVVVDTTG